MPEAAGLRYEEYGAPDAPPLILSAGLGGAGAYWQPNLAALAERRRVITYDHRGTGRSDRAVPAGLTIADMAADVAALMDALGLAKADFVGHALGGMIGLELALRHARVSRLVVVNGWLDLDPHTARCFDVRLDLLRQAGAEAYLRAQPLFLYPNDWISENDARLVAETVGHLAHFPDAATVEARIAAVRGFRMAPPADLGCPLLVVAAEDDFLVPARSTKALAAAVPGARLAAMKWGGHACNVTDPGQFNAIVKGFLGG
jgi:aminoacrylate hydrolase